MSSPRRPDPAGPWVTALLVLLVALGPITTDLYLPALPGMQDAFATDVATMQLTLSVYMIAFAASQLVYGPLSDRFGRRPPLIVGTALYFAASLACVYAPTVEWLIAARFLQGVGGCAGQVISRAVVRDVHGRAAAGRVLAKIAAAMGLAPAIGPALGGYLAEVFGWQACFWALSAAGGAALVGCMLLLDETNRQRDTRAVGPLGMARRFRGLLRHRQFNGFLLASAASYCGLFAWISGSSFVFIRVFGLAPDLYGYCFSAIVVGFIAGARIAARMTAGPARGVLAGALINAASGLAMLAVVLLEVEGVVTVLVPMILYMVGMGIVLPHGQAGAVGPFPRTAGSASSLFGFTQYGIAAAVGLAVGHGFDHTALPMALAIALSGLAALAAHRFLIRTAPEPVEAPIEDSV